jgi:carbonic anhydrase
MTSIINNCANITTPLNISVSKQSGKCDSKCDYSFKYQSSSCVTTNKGTYISVAYDSTTDQPVTYNSHKYNVTEIRIYSPSIHTYNNSPAAAEIIIIHTPVSGGNNLIVSVPVKIEASSSKGSTVVNNIIMGTVSKAPNLNESATLNDINTFTLNDIVPKNKPFFSYSGQEPFNTCSSVVDFVVFAPLSSDISINSAVLNKLREIIKNSGIVAKEPDNNTPLFVNERGSNTTNANANEDIYIDCQPVSQSEDTKDVVINTSYDPSPIDVKDIFNNIWFQVIAGSIGFFLLLCVLSALFSSFGKKSSSGTNMASNSVSKISSFVNK